MATCDICRKGRMFGATHRHHRGVAGGQWTQRAQSTKKVFNPNLHKIWSVINGKRVKLALCTKCLRRFKEEQKIKIKTSEAKAAPAAA